MSLHTLCPKYLIYLYNTRRKPNWPFISISCLKKLQEPGYQLYYAKVYGFQGCTKVERNCRTTKIRPIVNFFESAHFMSKYLIYLYNTRRKPNWPFISILCLKKLQEPGYQLYFAKVLWCPRMYQSGKNCQGAKVERKWKDFAFPSHNHPYPFSGLLIIKMNYLMNMALNDLVLKLDTFNIYYRLILLLMIKLLKFIIIH